MTLQAKDFNEIDIQNNDVPVNESNFLDKSNELAFEKNRKSIDDKFAIIIEKLEIIDLKVTIKSSDKVKQQLIDESSHSNKGI